MSTLFPSSELDRKLSEATSNEPGMPSSGLLYELGRATHRDDDYRIVTSAIWQTVLRSNQRPRVVLKTLSVLEAVLLHGPDRALEETMDMKTDIKALQSYSHSRSKKTWSAARAPTPTILCTSWNCDERSADRKP